MKTQDIRLSINQIVENTKDENVLETYYEILKNLMKMQKNQIVGYDLDGVMITRAALENEVQQASEAVKNGKSISHNDLMKDSDNW